MSDTDTQLDNSQNASNPSHSGSEPAPADNTADSAPAPAETAAEEPKRNGDGGFQRRINRLTREKHEALGRLDALEREVLELRERSRAPTSPSNASDQEPRQEQFTKYEDYVAAKAEWRAEQKLQGIEERLARRFQSVTAEQSREERMRAFDARLAQQGKGIEDFDEVMDAIKDPSLPVSPAMAEYLVEDSENTALMAKWLTDNPDEAARISRLKPTAVGKELSKVDAQLGAKPATRTTRAPAPVSTVGGSSAAQFDPRKTNDIEAWMAWRKQQD